MNPCYLKVMSDSNPFSRTDDEQEAYEREQEILQQEIRDLEEKEEEIRARRARYISLIRSAIGTLESAIYSIEWGNESEVDHCLEGAMEDIDAAKRKIENDLD